MSLKELRIIIDKIDTEMVELIAKRVRIAEQIGNEKKQLGELVKDNNREKVVFRKVREAALARKINSSNVENIYKQIIQTCRSVQQTSNVAFQGELGAYSEEAAFKYFGSSVTINPYESFYRVYQAMEDTNYLFNIRVVDKKGNYSASEIVRVSTY